MIAYYWFLLTASLGTIAVAVEWRLIKSTLPGLPARRPPGPVVAAVLCAYAGWYAIEVGRTLVDGSPELRTMLTWPTVGYAIPHTWLLWRLVGRQAAQQGEVVARSRWPCWLMALALVAASAATFATGGLGGVPGAAGAAALVAAVVACGPRH